MQLYSKEIEEYLGKRRDSTARAYGIYDEEGSDLAHLFTSRESYTLAWFGSVEFNDLGPFIEEGFLLRLLDDVYPYPLDYYRTQNRTSLVSLIVHETDISSSTEQQESIELPSSNPKLVRFEITNGKPPEDYLAYLREPNKISFARVDYKVVAQGWQTTPSFTAENPNGRPNNKAEIAVKTHRTYIYPYSLLRFIAQTILAGKATKEDDEDSRRSLVEGLAGQLDEKVYSSPLE